jgi:hypothetical protein
MKVNMMEQRSDWLEKAHQIMAALQKMHAALVKVQGTSLRNIDILGRQDDASYLLDIYLLMEICNWAALRGVCEYDASDLPDQSEPGVEWTNAYAELQGKDVVHWRVERRNVEGSIVSAEGEIPSWIPKASPFVGITDRDAFSVSITDRGVSSATLSDIRARYDWDMNCTGVAIKNPDRVATLFGQWTYGETYDDCRKKIEERNDVISKLGIGMWRRCRDAAKRFIRLFGKKALVTRRDAKDHWVCEYGIREFWSRCGYRFLPQHVTLSEIAEYRLDKAVDIASRMFAERMVNRVLASRPTDVASSENKMLV